MPQNQLTTRLADPARGAFVVGVGASLLCATAGLLLGGLQGLTSSVLASILVLVFFISGQLCEGVAQRMARGTGRRPKRVPYSARGVRFDWILWLAASTPAISGQWSRTWFAAGALTALIGWLTGLVVADSRARVPVYDCSYQAPEGWDR